MMSYVFSWVFQIILVFVLIAVAKAKSRNCEWNEAKAKSRLNWGIALVVFVQVADFIKEATTEGHGLGILYHIQWIGIYWVALAAYRRRILRQAEQSVAEA